MDTHYTHLTAQNTNLLYQLFGNLIKTKPLFSSLLVGSFLFFTLPLQAGYITFSNDGCRAVDIYWVSGFSYIYYGSLQADQSYIQQTYTGNVWSIELQNGTSIANYTATYAYEQFFSIASGGCSSSDNDDLSGFQYLGEFENSQYYQSIYANYTWAQANAGAQSLGGYLVEINSSAENNFLSQEITSTSWIGYTDQNSEGFFQWSSGNSSNYTNWNSGEPNDEGLNGYGADYSVIKPSGYWFDRNGPDYYTYIIEIPIEEPEPEECEAEITSIVFKNIEEGAELEIIDGAAYSVNELAGFNQFEALTSGDHESLFWEVTGAINNTKLENALPYDFPGNGNLLTLVPGNYTIKTTLYSEDNATGLSCETKIISFTVEEALASIGDHVWEDLNCDGIRTADEPYLENIHVKLWGDTNEDGTPDVELGNVITNADGWYSFENLNPNQYYIIQFILDPSFGMEFTTPNIGNSEEKDSDVIDRANGFTTSIFVSPGEHNYMIDAGLCASFDPCPENYFDGGIIEASACDDYSIVIESATPPNHNGQELEIVWLKCNQGDCSTAIYELSTIDLGATYNEFVVAGGFNGGANSIVGNTSWEFVKDNDANDLRFNVYGIATDACYMRFARLAGCKDFWGEAGPLSIKPSACIDCEETFNGGTIAQDDGASGYVVIENFSNPESAQGPIESIWLRTSNPDIDAALLELQGMNVGQIYNSFVGAGGFAGNANPQIPGTSWQFVNDGDNDQNSLNDTQADPNQTYCYLRCSRVEGCTNFHGESNPVIVNPEPEALAGFDACGNTLMANGLGNSIFSFFKVYYENYSGTAYECNSFTGGCYDNQEVTLPDGIYNIDILLLDDQFNELYRVVETVELPFDCIAPLTTGNNNNQVNNSKRPEELEIDLQTFPNPADKYVTFTSNVLIEKEVRVKVFNNIGQLMLDKNYENVTSDQIHLDVSTYQTGIYFAFIQVKAEQEMTAKFIVNRANAK